MSPLEKVVLLPFFYAYVFANANVDGCRANECQRLHFYGHQYNGNLTKPDGPQACAVEKWLNYEQFIDQAVEAATAAGAMLIFAKTKKKTPFPK